MRLLLTTFFCSAVILSAGITATAQDFVPTPVEISTEKVNVNGKIFFLHKVLKGQTLYSISKAYGVSIETIQEANPGLSDGLKTDMLLYIPQNTAAPSGTVQTAAVTGTEKQVSEQKESPAEKKSPVKKKKYRKYNVKWYETLDDVAVKFNVTVEAIVSLNDIDTTSGKRIRGILIPDREYMESMASTVSVPVRHVAEVTDTTGQEGSPVLHEDFRTFQESLSSKPYDKGPYTISLILPFNASELTGNINTYAADFYAGALIAAGELKEKGLMEHFVINTVDLNRYSSAWEMVSSGVLDGSELIIGPISERDLQPVASYARHRHIPVVSPLDLKTISLAEDNPYFFLFPPQTDSALVHQTDKIARDYRLDTTSSVTVIYERGYERSDLVTETFSELNRKNIPYRTFSYDFLSGRGIDTSMHKSLSSKGLNKVIIPSMSEAFITDALRNLNLIKASYNYRIEVYGLSRWKSFETIESNYFHNLDLRLSMSYHIDYNDSLTTEFIARYWSAFNTEPTSFSYQGYDILTFFVEAMNTYGKAYPAAIINKRKNLLQSDVLFLPIAPGSGYQNLAFKDICFTDGWVILQE